jgi:GT2 family glycosyltransferase/SAM-dependent methyltransferase/glycosyltransferase involved in cell wall biosynthesis
VREQACERPRGFARAARTKLSPARRAAAPRLIQWTGERCVPWAPDVQVVYEHYHRYLWAARVVRSLRVLDLGCGEGFGSAMLADVATEVIGVDIDERTVDHARVNYAAPGLSFELGSAEDLSAYEDGSFGAVVAFEVIEHIDAQRKVLEEVARVLADDGVFIVSTPDRRAYSDATGYVNPFHRHELTLEEFEELIAHRFSNIAFWAQRPITGSYVGPLAPPGQLDDSSREPALDQAAQGGAAQVSGDFFVERSGDEWRVAGEPAALYCIAVASRAPLPPLPSSSTLADCELELVRQAEREQARRDAEASEQARTHEHAELLELLERERGEHVRALGRARAQLGGEIERRDRDIARRGDDIKSLESELQAHEGEAQALRLEISSLESDLAGANQLNRRMEESVTWQILQRARARVYGASGERSLAARALSASLRLVGRSLFDRPIRPPADLSVAAEPEPPAAKPIDLPASEFPEVSLIIPLYAHADLTRVCLNSIRHRTTHVSYEVILVDDDADAETKRLLECVRGAKIVRNKQNLGYLHTINRGASVARADWLVLLNNDTEVTEGWLKAMVECAESAPDIAVVTPKYVYPDGTLNEAGAIIWRDGTGANYGRGDPPDLFQYEFRRETDYGSAAALLVRASFWKEVGGFDERFAPMYYEDTDLCFQARERGFRVLYEPGAVIIHHEGATAGTDVAASHKRHQEENRPKFVAKWRAQLESEHLRAASTNLRSAANRHRGPQVLVIDHRVPTWDRDSGSLRMRGLMRVLQGLGAHIRFLPDNLSPNGEYSRVLQREGIEVLYGALDVRAELAMIGGQLTAAILSRPHTAGRWLDLVREFAPAAIVAYDTVDLHWLREARRAALAGSWEALDVRDGTASVLTPKANALRHLELAMISAADVSLVVSESERIQVERDVPGASVLVVPNVHEVDELVLPAEMRSGVLFVGGFEHDPNVDGAICLVREVMPRVWRELGDVRVTIVGPDPPPNVRALESPLVDVTGWLPDLRPVIDTARVMVAPLRYGAGLKGKITQALAAGLPVVTTPIGAEGLELADGEALLLGDDPAQLARETIRVCRDGELWKRLSESGRALVARQCSSQVVTERLGTLLDRTPRPLAGDRDATLGALGPSLEMLD